MCALTIVVLWVTGTVFVSVSAEVMTVVSKVQRQHDALCMDERLYGINQKAGMKSSQTARRDSWVSLTWLGFHSGGCDLFGYSAGGIARNRFAPGSK